MRIDATPKPGCRSIGTRIFDDNPENSMPMLKPMPR
jgi:hypothetical protein